jgi:hypothetical protein
MVRQLVFPRNECPRRCILTHEHLASWLWWLNIGQIDLVARCDWELAWVVISDRLIVL